MTYRDGLYQAMRQAMAEHSNTVIFGQGVDDHKGIFGTTTDLQKEYGADRVFDTPLAEEAMTGVAVGMAMNGLYPINTHIRADFVLLAMNQIINLAAKYRYMFGGRFQVPMLIRMVVGRSWGQGAQHSQSLQSLFAHIPGLTVIMPSHPRRILDSYAYAVGKWPNPVLSIEHRLMYDLAFDMEGETSNSDTSTPFDSFRVRQGKDVTVVATSIMVLEALRAADHLSKAAGIECEVIDLHCLSHPTRALVLESVRKTGRLVVADTSWRPFGTGAEVCRWICEENPALLKSPAVTVGMAPSPCPTAKVLEDIYYPNLTTLSDTIATTVTGRKDHGIPLPNEQSMADIYKRFKGPF